MHRTSTQMLILCSNTIFRAQVLKPTVTLRERQLAGYTSLSFLSSRRVMKAAILMPFDTKVKLGQSALPYFSFQRKQMAWHIFIISC